MPFASQLSRLLHILLWASLCSTLTCLAHPGKLDTLGGHIDKKTGTYHCHSAACFRQHQQSQEALEEAIQGKRAFSRIYDRKDWPHWSDLDKDCQDTRSEILISSSKVPVTFNQGNTCYTVIAGEWHDPYTNRTFSDASDVDIDHRIALAEAHRYGGANWPGSQKEAFANDPLNLVAVQRAANRAKGSLPAYLWMPKYIPYWCEYIKAREAVVTKYRLQFPEQELRFNNNIKQQYCR